jgi:hypothetical protein
LKPGAEKYRVVRGADDTGLYSSCTPPGVPQTFMVPYYVQFVQSPKYLIILHEYLHLSRTITLDGSPHPPDPDPFWMGHSTGKWEGDTLVVDSVGFKESEINGYKTTEDLHVVERFRRPNMGHARIRSHDRGPERVRGTMADHAELPAAARIQPRRRVLLREQSRL